MSPSPEAPPVAQVRSTRWRERALIVVCGAGLLGPLLGPGLRTARSHYLGLEDVDYYGTLWFYWYTARQVEIGEGIGHTDLFFHPFGKNVLLDTGANVLDAFVAWPFIAAFGDVLGFNLFLLTALAFSGWAFWTLARGLGSDRVASGVGALLFTAAPFALFELSEGRPTQGILGLLPLVLLSAWRVAERPGWRWPALGGVLLALLAFQYWFYALFGGFVVAALAAVMAIQHVRDGGPRPALIMLARFALMALVAGAITSPVAIPLALAAAEGQANGLLDVGGWTLDHVSLLTERGESVALSSWQPLNRSASVWATDSKGREYITAGGQLSTWLALALAGVGLFRPRGLPRSAWLAMAGVAAVVAVGPILVLGSDYLINPVYVAMVKTIDVTRRLWWPVRAYAWLAVFFTLSATWALGWARQRGLGVQGLLALAVTAAWGAELWWAGVLPMPSWQANIPAGYHCLAHGPSGGIIELPYGYTQAHIYYQSVHGRPMLGGMAERSSIFEPLAMRELRTDNSFLRAIIETADSDAGARAWTDADKDAVAELGYRYVVLQKDSMSMSSGLTDGANARSWRVLKTTHKTRLRRLRKALSAELAAPVYEDDRVAIYAPWDNKAPCDATQIQRDERPRARPLLLEDIRPAGPLPDSVQVTGPEATQSPAAVR